LACTQPAVPPGHVWPTQNELNKSRNELKKKTHLEFLVMSTALGPFPALARGARPLAQWKVRLHGLATTNQRATALFHY